MSENQKPTTTSYRENWQAIWGTKVKHKTRDSALPRRRSADARALQSPRHRQQVIPDKRWAANERAANEETRAVALGLEPLNVPSVEAANAALEQAQSHEPRTRGALPPRGIEEEKADIHSGGGGGGGAFMPLDEETRAALGLDPYGKAALEAFVRESNRIEGILRDPTDEEMDAHVTFLNLASPHTEDMEALVSIVAPGHRLRDAYGLDVRVGNYVAPRGCPEIRDSLDTLMARVANRSDQYSAWQAHIDYETLHPFTDGNGRSGRALWLWQLRTAPLGFLHHFYYQTLSAIGRSPWANALHTNG
jgi:hypothetical protein